MIINLIKKHKVLFGFFVLFTIKSLFAYGLFLLMFTSCQQFDSSKNSNPNISTDSVIIKEVNGIKRDSVKRSDFEINNIQDSSRFCKIDTLKLKAFWNDFIIGVKTKNKKIVFRSINLNSVLFLGSLIATPNSMKNCDGEMYMKISDKYGIEKLTEKNFDKYFDSIFNENFIELMSNLKIDSIMKNGWNSGYSYVYSYKPNIKDFPCSEEQVVVINLFYCNEFKITIDFCC
jgi:hypothetical protein